MKPEEYAKVLTLLQKVAAERNEDLFRLRVVRRNHSGDLGTQWATMRDARIEHLSSPETWLSKLAAGGGGHFSIMVAHDKAPGVTLGELMVQFPGTETKPQREALSRQEWDGPGMADFLSGEHSPSALPRSLPAGTALPVNVPGTRSQADLALAEENRMLKERLDRNDRQAELDRLERRHKEDMDNLRRELAANKKPEGPDPIVQVLLEQGKQQSEMFREMSKQQREDQQRADERFLKMLENNNKKPDDPMVTALIKSHFDDTGRNVKQYEGIAAMTNLMMTGAMQMMTHQVEMAKQMQPATEDLGPFARIAEKIADAALASKTSMEPAKQLPAGETQAPVQPQGHVSADDTKEAWEEVDSLIREKKPAHEIVPALLVAFHGEPLRGMLGRHKTPQCPEGDLSLLVEELYTPWVMESPKDRLQYVKTELFKVEMSLVALNIVRPSAAFKKHMAELDELARARATVAPQPLAPAVPPAPHAAVQKPLPPPPVVQEAGRPFKKIAKSEKKNGKGAEPPVEDAAPAEAELEAQPKTAVTA